MGNKQFKKFKLRRNNKTVEDEPTSGESIDKSSCGNDTSDDTLPGETYRPVSETNECKCSNCEGDSCQCAKLKADQVSEVKVASESEANQESASDDAKEGQKSNDVVDEEKSSEDEPKRKCSNCSCDPCICSPTTEVKETGEDNTEAVIKDLVAEAVEFTKESPDTVPEAKKEAEE